MKWREDFKAGIGLGFCIGLVIMGVIIVIFNIFGWGILGRPQDPYVFSTTESQVDTLRTETPDEIRLTITKRIMGVDYNDYYDGLYTRLHYYSHDSLDSLHLTYFYIKLVGAFYQKNITPIDSIVQTVCYRRGECK